MKHFILFLKFYQININLFPKDITIDFSKALHNAIKQVYPKSIILTCYFHYDQNLYNHIPEVKSNNKALKKEFGYA